MFIVVSEDILLQNQAKVKSNPKVELDEESLSYLFNETYPHNTNLKEINIKVSALNTLYSTHLRSYTFNVAKHIHSLAIDDRLKQGDITLVDDIIKTPRGEGKQFRCYSFATKYCSFHRPDIFPIYDSYVDKLLVHLQKQDGFAGMATWVRSKTTNHEGNL